MLAKLLVSTWDVCNLNENLPTISQRETC